MKRDPRFFAGLVGVALVLTYLVWTGVNETMVYYLMPHELVERVREDPSLHEVGFKVSGKVVPGSHEEAPGAILHRFVVRDTEKEDVEIPVEFAHPLPNTFADGEDDDTEVVMEGRYRSDGVFEATEVLTKCGSRYEAIPDEADYKDSDDVDLDDYRDEHGDGYGDPDAGEGHPGDGYRP